MNISHDDRQNLDRLLDGELPPERAAALRARLAAEPALRTAFEERQRLRGAFASAASTRGFAAPAGFTASVLAATRGLPARREIEEREVADHIVRVCRRVLIAAAVVVGLGIVWQSGLWRRDHDSRLQAAPNEVEQEMNRLDALIGADEAGGTKPK